MMRMRRAGRCTGLLHLAQAEAYDRTDANLAINLAVVLSVYPPSQSVKSGCFDSFKLKRAASFDVLKYRTESIPNADEAALSAMDGFFRQLMHEIEAAEEEEQKRDKRSASQILQRMRKQVTRSRQWWEEDSV